MGTRKHEATSVCRQIGVAVREALAGGRGVPASEAVCEGAHFRRERGPLHGREHDER